MGKNQADKPLNKFDDNGQPKNNLRSFIEELDPQEKVNEGHQNQPATSRYVDQQNKMIDQYNLRK
ncbi:hypothetical protein SAMN02799630_01627 [Paenibacillus sp. UNCCL117]|uniref:hypothetical protein n=1 Tax=unclassified Paenibacillus TaxID=185978 RepID=UPI000882E5E8|nr:MULTISPECIES: hypothetical protein [unclassified Paenibacillus]SDC88955.1 hypothetical protein SAMN04488602_104112 [Paenibacillus sp. cl123]SFW28435.1 hypothetical protein SAMN02799630_01627 [Paenibacillus sp. UNCCL117]